MPVPHPFSVSDADCDECAVLVWAYAPEEAVSLAMAAPNHGGAVCLGEREILPEACAVSCDWPTFAGLKAHGLAPPEAPCAETNDRRARVLGWREEGESTCEACDLAPNGIKEFELCDTCGCCRECAAEEDDLEYMCSACAMSVEPTP